jgi:hypothetical protein
MRAMNAEAGSRALNDPDATASRAPRIAAHAPALVIAAALIVFAVAYAMDWRLPGLYMDAVNPEYIIPGIFDPKAPGHHPWILPGNLIHGRFPLFTGQIYHGSTQIYFALPLMALFGVDVGTLRITQGAAGFLIVLLLALFLRRTDAPAKSAIAAAAMLPLALDPSFVVALRTQAYSCLFPLMLLLGAMLLIRGWQTKKWRAFRLFVSGVLFGLSVFSYFIFAFFFPALVWFLLTERESKSSRDLRYLALWLLACGIGYFPLIGGLFRIAQAMGGLEPMLRWLHGHSDSLHPLGSSGGVLDRIHTMFFVARGVVTGRWPWLMVLQHHSGELTGSLKAALLVLVPIGTLIAARSIQRDDRRAIVVPLVFVVSFLVCASAFGNRLDGHHYTTILPFLYAAFGAACAALWMWPRDAASSRAAWLLPATGVALVASVAAMNAFNLAHFHRDLEASGGAALYTEAIDRFSHNVAKDDPGATAYFPDWGYVMPFVFVTRASIAQRDSVDTDRIARETCAGKPQIVVFTGADNAAKFDVVTTLAHQAPPAITTWTQRDGVPVFQSARYAPRTDCTDVAGEGAPPAPEVGAGPAIAVAPAAASDCEFLSPISATARWDAGNPALERVEVWITPPGDKPKLWAAGADRFESSTGQWAIAGMTFTLIDPVTQETLARTEIARVACPVH